MKTKNLLHLFLTAAVAVSCNSGHNSGNDELGKQVDELLGRMTLEEKIGQMTQITVGVVGKGSRYNADYPFQLDTDKLRDAVVNYKVGSILNCLCDEACSVQCWNDVISKMQDVAIKETRLGIPIVYGIDAVHGHNYVIGGTIFPQQITMAATWDDSNPKTVGEICAYEARACGHTWNFSPILDLGNDPRFSRIYEGFGEDPYLCGKMGAAFVKGYEGENNDVSDPTKVASCIKHFLCYGAPVSGKDRTPIMMPENTLREYHLAPFKEALDAGAKSLMVNSGLINGMPVHADYHLLTEILKEELGFNGVVVTDWADIENIHTRDKVASSHKDAIKKCINAGIDMSMVPYEYERFADNLKELVVEGEVKMSRIDDAVRRILRMKFELGLFDKPMMDMADYPDFGSKEFARKSYDMACEAITLLKNEKNVLPLSKDKRILVCGPNANSMRALNGGWTYSWQGKIAHQFTEDFNTILGSMKLSAPNVKYVPGVSYIEDGGYHEDKLDQFDRVAGMCAQSDVIVLCLGENSYAEKPGDLHDLSLSENQLKLAREVAKSGKPVVLVLNEGRPRIFSSIEPMMNAIVHTYLPGNHGGDATAAVLFGEVNPSGKLPYTYPIAPNSLVPYYHKPSEEQKKMIGAYDYEGDFTPQFEFGHGLSYTSFEYSDLKVNQENFDKNGVIELSVNVRNTGSREGKEVVQLYSSDLYASLSPDMKRLRRFQKVNLLPGEIKNISFTLPVSELAFVNLDNKHVVEPGEFSLNISNLSSLINVK